MWTRVEFKITYYHQEELVNDMNDVYQSLTTVSSTRVTVNNNINLRLNVQKVSCSINSFA